MEKFSKIIVLTIIGLSAAGALYVCCSHTLSHRSRTAEIDIPSKPSLPEVRRARLVFAGDLMQHTPQLTAARTPEGDFDFNASFDWVRERFRAADAAIVNLETTLSESGPYTVTPASAPLRLWPRHSTPWAWTLPYWPTTTAATADRKASVRRSGNSTGTASNIRAFFWTARISGRGIRSVSKRAAYVSPC